MEEWQEYKLGEVAQIQTGPFGSQLHKSDYVDDGVPCIMPTNIGKHLDIVSDGIAHISANDAQRLSRHLVTAGDIIYARRGDIEKCAYIQEQQNGWFCGTGCLRIRISKDADSHFIAYQLSTSEAKNWIIGNAVGTTMLNLNSSILSDLPILLPSLSTQRHITAILKSLDDKIELNRRINHNLEQQAQALFKSWFVDFEPFKDGEFVESELGMIPKKWKVGNYDEIIKETISGDWGKEKPQGNYIHKVACIRGCDFQDIKNGLRGKTPERYILEKNYQSKRFLDKDILVEISGGTATISTGRVCPVSQQLIDKFDSNIVCTNFCRIVRPKSGFGAYLYFSWLYKYNNKIMFGYENGTSGIKNFRIKDFTALEPILIPPQDVVIRFQCLIDTILILMQSRGTELQRLSQLRDALLPRLMSGEIKVGDMPL